MPRHSAATAGPHLWLCRSINPALPSSPASFPLSSTVPPLELPFLSSQGFLCNFLLKVKGNNKARAALQPPPDIAAPSMAARPPGSALPAKPRSLPSWLLLEGLPSSGGICRQEHTFGFSWFSPDVLPGTFRFTQRIATTRASKKKRFQPTERNNNKRLMLSFPVLRQYSLSFSHVLLVFSNWVLGKWVEDVEILLQKHLPTFFPREPHREHSII